MLADVLQLTVMSCIHVVLTVFKLEVIEFCCQNRVKSRNCEKQIRRECGREAETKALFKSKPTV